MQTHFRNSTPWPSIPRGSRQLQGSALLIALFLTTTLCVTVAGYLSFVSHQTFMSVRSQAWNMGIGAAEAGIEDGLEQLNSNSTNLTADGWSFDGTLYSRVNTLPDGRTYFVTIDLSMDPANPTITSKAFVDTASIQPGNDSVPVTRAVQVHASNGSLFIKGMAAGQVIDLGGNNVVVDSFDSTDPNKSTNGQYDPAKAQDHGDVMTDDTITNSVNIINANVYGHVATGPGGTIQIGPNGGVGTHAWQQLNTGTYQPGYVAHNANFSFPDTTLPYTSGPAPLSGSVVIATTTQSTNTVTSATFPSPAPAGGVTTNVTWVPTSSYPSPAPAGIITNLSYVTVTTAPNPAPAGMVQNTVTTAARSKTAPAAGTYLGAVTKTGAYYYYNQITGYSYTYPLYTYSYPTLSYSYSQAAPVVTYTTNSYDYVLWSGNYYLDNALSGKVIVMGQATLVDPAGINMSGNDSLTIAQGADLKMYVDSSSVKVSGNGLINQGSAANFTLYCTPNVTSVSLSGNAQFTGVIVAPNALLSMTGGGNNNMDFSGAVMARSVKLQGKFNFHYDEALGRLGGTGRYLVTSWDEIVSN